MLLSDSGIPPGARGEGWGGARQPWVVAGLRKGPGMSWRRTMGGMNGGLKVAKCGNSFFYGPKSGHKGPRVVWCGAVQPGG